MMSVGCGAMESQKPEENPTKTEKPVASAEPSSSESIPPQESEEPVQHDPQTPEGYTVTVSSVEELLEAIGPHVGILIKPGYYNLSEYIEDVWSKEGESWNAAHPYVQLQKCYDGVEIVIRRVEDLSIYGDNENLTEIVIDPRYGQVLNFEECHNISLSGLTMGHTEIGECNGNVLDFYGCRNINLSAMDLYGCGVYGIGCFDGTGELYAYGSTIRDCSSGALQIGNGNGRFEFHNCMLTGSEGFDCYEPTPYSELAFYECVFGDNETSYYMFHDDVYTEDCVWSENYIYPEYGYEEEGPVFHPETMKSAVVDQELLEGTFWYGYAMVNPESGETVMIFDEEEGESDCRVSLQLHGDGIGWYENTGESHDITWSCDDGSLAWITLEDGRNYYISAYTMADEDHVWLLLELEECMVWLY